MLTRKHFIQIAAVVSSIKDDEDRARITSMLCGVLRGTNPNFNTERFIAACMAGSSTL